VIKSVWLWYQPITIRVTACTNAYILRKSEDSALDRKKMHFDASFTLMTIRLSQLRKTNGHDLFMFQEVPEVHSTYVISSWKARITDKGFQINFLNIDIFISILMGKKSILCSSIFYLIK
jgi:hypothetical protein